MNNFVLKFLWSDKSVAVALDQKINNKVTPVTEYFFWPRRDAWEDLKKEMENKPWISNIERVELLNKTTEVINFWQEKNKTDRKEINKILMNKFPDCSFFGA